MARKKTPLMLGIIIAAIMLIFQYIFVSAAPPSISGYVTRFNGQAISGANVTLYNVTDDSVIGTNLTDTTGRYLIDFLDGGDFYVVFNTSSSYLYGTSTSRNYTLSIASGENALLNTSFYLKNFGSYNITVKDAWNGRPIPYANITVYYKNTNQYLNKIAGADGTAIFEVGANSTTNAGVLHDIYVEKSGYKSSWTYSQSVYEGTNKDLELNMTGSCLIHGIVSDSGENLITPNIENAYIELWDNTSTSIAAWPGNYNYTARSDSNGQYSISYPSSLPGTYNCDAYLHISAPGYTSDNLIQIQSSTVKDINLTGSALVTGRIMDISNTSHPIEGAQILLRYAGQTIYATATDANGYFNKSIKDGLNHTLAVSATGYMPYQNITVYNTTTDYGTIYLEGTGTLNMTLIDETNTTIVLEGVTVEITSTDSQTSYTATTDSTGKIGIMVRDSTEYYISFSKNGYYSESNTTEVSGATDLGQIDLRGENWIHGYVEDSKNIYIQTIENARIYFMSNTDNKRYTTYSGSEGNYSFYADSSIDNYTILFDKEGYNITSEQKSDTQNAEINTDLIGATHISGTVYDIYSPAIPGIPEARIDIKDPDGNIHYTTTTNQDGNYSLDLGVNFIYSMDITRTGYQDMELTAMPWDQDRTGSGGADRIEDIYMNGSTQIHVTVIDGFDNMTIDNAQVCVLFASYGAECFYTKITDLEGESTFNIRTGEDYRLKVTRTNYVENSIYPLDGSTYSGDFTGTIRLNAYAWIYAYDTYALHDEEIYDAEIEIYTYNNQTDYDYYINETMVNVTAYCNSHQEDGLFVTLNSTTGSYISSLVTTSGNPMVSFRTVPIGTYTLLIDGESAGCGNYSTTITITDPGMIYTISYTTDNIAPEIWNLTEVQDPTEFIDNLTISADIIDRTTSISYAFIEFGPENYTSNHTMINTGENRYSYTWTPDILGLLNYIIWTEDERGNINMTSGNVTIQDTIPPTVTIITQDNGNYNTNSITISYIPEDFSGFTGCDLWSDTTGSWSLNTSNATEIIKDEENTITISGIPDGEFSANIMCTDRGGNTASAPSDIHFTVDAQAPLLTALTPENKSYSNYYLDFNVTSNKPLRSANLSFESLGNVTLYNSSPTHFYISGGLWDGIYNIIYYGMSYNGHLGATTPIVFKVDTVSPDTTGTYPEDSDSFVGPAIINFTVDADEIVNMSLAYWNSTDSWTLTDSGFEARVEGNSVLLYTGTYNWNYTLCDEAGNCDSGSTHTFSVYTDTTAPTSSSVSSSSSTITQADTVILRAFWTDTESGLSTAILETDESGVWANKTVYGSPQSISGATSWSNFTWHNASVPGGSTVSWRIWAKDTKDNYGVTPTQTFTVLEAMQLTVYVNDQNGNPVQPDYTGLGAEVTLSNATYTSTKNTSSLGYATFPDLGSGSTYDVSVDGTSQGYGTGSTTGVQITGSDTTTISIDMTRLIVNVTDSSYAPVSGATVTVYESDDTTIAKNASNDDLTGTSDASGIVWFDRALPYASCNVTVSKAGPIINSTDANIIAGNTSNYAWVDPPQSIGNTFNLNFSLTSTRIPAGVTINIKEYNSTIIIGTNTTDSNGNTIIYNISSGIYDFELDGENVGFDKVTYRRNIVGVHTMNTGRTDESGRVRINVNGLLTYYVSVNSPGYVPYDDYYDGSAREGTYDDSINSTGIKPMINLSLRGNTTLTGHAYDINFKGPVNLTYEPISNTTIKVYTQTSCATTPAESLLRYQTLTTENGTYTIIMSPVQKDSPDTLADYCMDITSNGFINLKQNNIDIRQQLDLGMTGAGTVSGTVLDLNSMLPINSTVTIISKECYGGIYGPIEGCTAYQSMTASDGTFNFNVNTRGSGYAVEYMPYTLRFDSIGHSIRTGDTISSLPYENDFYLIPAPTSALRLKVTSEYGEELTDNIEVTITGIANLTGSDCIVQGNEYLCILESGQYDILANSTDSRYGYSFIQSQAINGDTLVTAIINTTKAIITLIDEDGNPLDGVNVTLVGENTYTNTTISGTTIISKIIPDTYDIQFDGLPEYYGIINGTVTISEPGETNSETYYANITQYYINISNATSGISGIDVTINDLFGTTNETGEIYFSAVNRSYTNSTLTLARFNRTDIYEKGYFAPEIMTTIYAGLDRESGNNMTIILNSTSGYGIFRVSTDTEEVNITVWYNETQYISSEITSYDNIAFIYMNASEYNESLYITAQKEGYEDYVAGPFNTSSGNITYIDIEMTSLYGTCSDGAITSYCYCAGTLYSTGYCCSDTYSTSSCTSTSTSSSTGGTSSSSSSSSGGSPITIPDNVETTPESDEYDISVRTEQSISIDISSGYPACVDMPVYISNTGNINLEDLTMRITTEYSSLATEYESIIGYMATGTDTNKNIKICLEDDSIGIGTYTIEITISNKNITKNTYTYLDITDSTLITLISSLNMRIESLTYILESIEPEQLDDELRQYYDYAKENIEEAKISIIDGEYDDADESLDEAENAVNTLKEKMRTGNTEESISSMYIAGGSILALILMIVAYIIYAKYMRKDGSKELKPIIPLPISMPRINANAIKMPAMKIQQSAYRLLGMHKVYYSRELSKRRFMTDVIEKVLEIRCPKCGGRIYQNRCIWCGHKIQSLKDTHNPSTYSSSTNTINKRESYAPEKQTASHSTTSDTFYTHQYKSNTGSERYVTDAFEHVTEKACPKCGGRLFNGKCVWCGN